MENTLLEQIGFIMGEWIPKEASIAISDGSRYIYFKSGIHGVHIPTGTAVPETSIAALTYKEGKRVEMLIENSVFGAPYYGVGYPISLGDKNGALVLVLPPEFILKKKQPLQFLTGKTDETWRPVSVEKISHIESSQKKTWFYSEEEMYGSNHTLKNLRYQLPDCFLSIHRSYIVNIHYIVEISRDLSSNYVITLQDGSVLPVSQNYTGVVRERLGF
ncbi:MAG TPA: LytTR family DNA-binding domain-containing protein [Planococcus sp. (in: firmicutes)]|nr:LytTR family DNA-binding domain-containing protein [Planococcus sp. (in: firmicutes)]